MTINNTDSNIPPHHLALELEEKKWGYRKLELQYLEAGQHLRSLNQLMWQVPSMAIATTGGLWYGATTVEFDITRTWVLVFTAIINFLTIPILLRIRSVIEKHISFQVEFSDSSPPNNFWKKTVITCWSLALLVAASISLVGACYPSKLGEKSMPEKMAADSNISILLPHTQFDKSCVFIEPKQASSVRKIIVKKKTECPT